MQRWHREIDLPLLLAPREAIYPQELFFDTRYHLDGAGARRHTARLAKALRPHVARLRHPAPALAAPGHALAQLDAAFAGWEPLAGFGPVEGPYPKWNLGAVIWALGERSSLAARALGAGIVDVKGSVRAVAPRQRLEVYAGGRKVHEQVFTQATEFEDLAFAFESSGGDALLQSCTRDIRGRSRACTTPCSFADCGSSRAGRKAGPAEGPASATREGR